VTRLAGWLDVRAGASKAAARAVGVWLACVAALVFAMLKDAYYPENFLGIRPWYGPLIYYILPPALLAMVFWLTWRNFAFMAETRVVWRLRHGLRASMQKPLKYGPRQVQ